MTTELLLHIGALIIIMLSFYFIGRVHEKRRAIKAMHEIFQHVEVESGKLLQTLNETLNQKNNDN
jgi:hypothetical protein